MTLLLEMTGAQLADALRWLPAEPDPHTGWLSQLDEAALMWALEHPELHELRGAFSRARFAYQDTRAQRERVEVQRLAWAGVLTAAEGLASLLAEPPLADARPPVRSA